MSYFRRLWMIWFLSVGAPLFGAICIVGVVLSETSFDKEITTWVAAILVGWLIAGLLWLADRHACPECGTSIWGTPRIYLTSGMRFDFFPPPLSCRQCGHSFEVEHEG